MPTLYVENVPDEVYEALRVSAKNRRSSIAAEVVALLVERFPTAAERQRRRSFLDRALKIGQEPFAMAAVAGTGAATPTEQLQREDRDR
jgi:plasmid stability protein